MAGLSAAVFVVVVAVGGERGDDRDATRSTIVRTKRLTSHMVVAAAAALVIFVALPFPPTQRHVSLSRRHSVDLVVSLHRQKIVRIKCGQQQNTSPILRFLAICVLGGVL